MQLEHMEKSFTKKKIRKKCFVKNEKTKLIGLFHKTRNLIVYQKPLKIHFIYNTIYNMTREMKKKIKNNLNVITISISNFYSIYLMQFIEIQFVVGFCKCKNFTWLRERLREQKVEGHLHINDIRY